MITKQMLERLRKFVDIVRAADVDAHRRVVRGCEVVDSSEVKNRRGLGPGGLKFNRRKPKILLRDVALKNAKIAARSIRCVRYAVDLRERAFHERRLHQE